MLKANFEITSLNALKAPDFLQKIKKPPLVLSFDDGYRDFLEYALPILMNEKVPVNQNIVVHSAETGNLIWTQRFNNIIIHLAKLKKAVKVEKHTLHYFLDPQKPVHIIKKEFFNLLFNYDYPFLNALAAEIEEAYQVPQPEKEMMTWEEVRTCQAWGVHIGSHSFYHSPLHRPSEIWDVEIFQSKKMMEARLGANVDTFAFPNGLVHPEAYQKAQKAGYEHILLIEGAATFKPPQQAKPGGGPYFRRLIGHDAPYENFFNAVGFHRFFKRR
ncbi:MAG: polysaccharide deacetylase family protein [Flavobacteriales bacterium]|nr:polysaccharide deacetylase family protein [Flavobacteriales bacterium]